MESPIPGSEGFDTTLHSISIFPSGNIENISSVTESSEVSSIKQVSEIPYYNDIPPLEREIDFNPQNFNLPSSIKDTLKANAELLVDKNILNHLLEPENANSMLNNQEIMKSFAYDFAGPVDERIPSRKLSNEHSNGLDNYPENEKQEMSSMPYLSISSTPKKSVNSHSNVRNYPLVPTSHSKHVNFAPEMKVNELPRGFSGGNCVQPITNHQSFTSYGTEIVFDKLGEIRHNLDLNKENEESSLSELPLSRLFIAKLKIQKQRNKDLEEELTLNEASLAKKTCELDVVQKRLQRREEQLHEAGEQIGKLQNDWHTIQQKLITSRDSYRSQNEQLKMDIETLKHEKEAAEKDNKILRDEQKQFSSLKVHAEGMKYEMERSDKRSEEISLENQRLNDRLKSAEEKLHRYENEIVPKLEEELKKLEEENARLHSKLDNLSLMKNKTEEDLKMLKERHSAILFKAVEDEQLKKKAIQEKEICLEEVSKLEKEKPRLMEELHEEYQSQLQAILLKRITEIGVHFDEKEKKLRDSFAAEIHDLRRSFENEKEGLTNRNLEEQERLKKKHSRENLTKDSVVLELKNENKHLRTQLEAIFGAISSVMSKTKDGSADQKVENRLENLRNITAYPRLRPEMANNYPSLDQYRNLEPGKSEGMSFGKENHQHKKSSSNTTDFAVRPLIASTSLSCLSNDDNDLPSSAGEISSRGRKQNFRGKNKGKPLTPLHKPKPGFKTKFNGRKVVSAAQLLGSSESLVMPDDNFLKEVDEEMSDLLHEINSISSINAPEGANETPRHDTSLDQDSAHLTLQKIDFVSEKLSKYINGTKHGPPFQ